MRDALANQADIPFRIPAGIKLVRVNYNNGKPAKPSDTSVITEALKPEFNFDEKRQRVIGASAPEDNDNDAKDDVFDESDEADFQLGAQY